MNTTTSYLRVGTLMAIMSLFGTGLFAQAGRVDSTFVPSGSLNVPEFDGVVTCLALQPNGKVLASGTFQQYNGISRNRIARLDALGNLDGSFDAGVGFDGEVNVMALQADGKILVGGFFYYFNGESRNRIARLNTDGSLDTAFDPGTGFNGNYVYALAIQPDGKIIVGGEFDTCQGTAINRIARLNTNGSLDLTFNPGQGISDGRVQALALQPDGKVVAGGLFFGANGLPRYSLVRFNADGSLDNAFFTGESFLDARIRTLLLSPDGKIYVGGNLPEDPGGNSPHLSRILPNGDRDSTFHTNAGFDNYVYALALQPDGKLLVGGGFSTYQLISQKQIARLFPNGDIDGSFQSQMGNTGEIDCMALQADGNLMVGGTFDAYGLTAQNKIARLLPDGNLDIHFRAQKEIAYSGFSDQVWALAALPDGKIMVGGDFDAYCGDYVNGIVRLNPEGNIDTTFNGYPNNFIQTKAMSVQADGKIVLLGLVFGNGIPTPSLLRLHPNGSKDESFEVTVFPTYAINSVVIQPDGKIIVGGEFEYIQGVLKNNIVRFSSNGMLDNSFNVGSGFNGRVESIDLQPDGKVIVVGLFTSCNGITRKNVARLESNGTLDLSFEPNASFIQRVQQVILQPDGKVIVGGQFNTPNGIFMGACRLNANGSRDFSFVQGSGIQGIFCGFSLALQANGKILMGGCFDNYNGTSKQNIVRLNADGSIDGSFVTDILGGGSGGSVQAIAIQPDEKILLGGAFYYSIQGMNYMSIMRILGNEITGIEPQQALDTRLSVYPNPNSGQFSLHSDTPMVQANLRLINLQGQLIRQEKNLNGCEWNLDYSGLSSGIYLLQITQAFITTSLRLVVRN